MDFIKQIITPEDLLKFHEQCTERGRELIRQKNHDYAGYSNAGQPLDVFRNFRAHEAYGICVRAGDKLKRMENFAQSGGVLKVSDETIFDTAIDLMNYAVLYLAYLWGSVGRDAVTVKPDEWLNLRVQMKLGHATDNHFFGSTLGCPVFRDEWWVPVSWDNDSKPDWVRLNSLLGVDCELPQVGNSGLITPEPPANVPFKKGL